MKFAFSKTHLLFACAIFLLLALLVYIAMRFRLFSKIEVKEMALGSGILVFTPYRGSYSNVSEKFAQAMKDFSEFFGKDVRYFGIYYDNPSQLVDPNEGRAIIGACFDETRNLESFINKHKNYRTVEFKNLKGFGATFPLYNNFDLLVAVVRGYPAIRAYGIEKKLMDRCLCSVEFYDNSRGTLTIAFPYHENNESILYQTGYPVPVIKDDQSVKRSVLKKDE
ncbi:uncharacterized protein VICG_01415 [Vittaforma corneae ATCC 50505]|uniref:GyrI-like small molecule binding domain-containing protein n=1 Tax=Vittaforma corneae (strain ATCC 50505) TaxID=993615 RepID=L2GL22_VITCO|nr:uncharacterized protein VICG_01415 [Vittaforma corneae ATCC 50505]ELA41551.1 hypothetical protein VICG_01415 [Vittaforma corneae ATCC 50505]